MGWIGLGWAGPTLPDRETQRHGGPKRTKKRTKNDAVAGPKTARLNPAKEKLLAELWQGPHQWAALGLGLAGLAGLGWTGLGLNWAGLVLGGCAGHGAGLGVAGWGVGWAGVNVGNPGTRRLRTSGRPKTRPQSHPLKTTQRHGGPKRTKNGAFARPRTARLNPAKEKLLQGPHQWAALGLGLAGLAGLGWTGLG